MRSSYVDELASYISEYELKAIITNLKDFNLKICKDFTYVSEEYREYEVYYVRAIVWNL
ncbi:MAG: hypothetical protein GX660_28180 [Clostridiaceae bacterium]|nr:hypothetical protein [Clostridiaceae bacterium]